MRKISGAQIAVFCGFLLSAVASAVGTTWLLLGWLPLGDFRGIVLALGFLIFLYSYALLLFNLFMHFFVLHEGEIIPGSNQEFIYHVYLLFFLILFYPVMRSGAFPVPMMRPFVQALGAKMGTNTYSSGIILDPIFVQLGNNTLVGQFALIVPHVIEGERLAHHRITIGNNVTIGAGAIVLAGVSVGDNCIVSTGAVVTKGTVIPAGEIWGGVPAKRIGSR